MENRRGPLTVLRVEAILSGGIVPVSKRWTFEECAKNLSDALEIRRLAWWSDARVVALIAALASGQPLQPIFTPDRAFGIMLAIRDRIEDRAP